MIGGGFRSGSLISHLCLGGYTYSITTYYQHFHRPHGLATDNRRHKIQIRSYRLTSIFLKMYFSSSIYYKTKSFTSQTQCGFIRAKSTIFNLLPISYFVKVWIIKDRMTWSHRIGQIIYIFHKLKPSTFKIVGHFVYSRFYFKCNINIYADNVKIYSFNL